MRKLLPARVATAEQRARHSPVLGGIEGAAGRADDAIERLKEALNGGAFVGKVECQRNSSRGNDSIPGELTEPRRFRTARNEPRPLLAIVSSNSDIASWAVEVGTTHWYW